MIFYQGQIFAAVGGEDMPDIEKVSCAHLSAPASESYAIASGFLALFGPRPSFIFSAQRRETSWQQWQEAGIYHGLAKFGIDSSGLIDAAPAAAAVPERKKKYWMSSRQFAGRC